MIRITAIAALLLATPVAAQDTAEPPQLEHAFTIIAEIGEAVDVGRTGRGIRRFIPITGGTVEGEDISGRVLPGAWDWQLDRPDGCTELVADYFIETDEGAVINVVNQATLCPPAEGEARQPAFTRPVFEPPLGEHEWLGRSVFVGRLEMAQDHPVPAVRIAVFEVK